jgi:hypothetical protein
VPDNAPEFASDAFDRVDDQVVALLAGSEPGTLETGAWVSQQWVQFIRTLPLGTGHEVLRSIDAAFGFSSSGNIEIATAWLELAVASGYAFEEPDVDQALASFLTRHGRALYVRRVYEKLASSERGRARAEEIYAAARPRYHSVTQAAVDRILGISP